uniref:uncharacterized protein LOC120342736 n=1 Tax=Styela clava TaxID=7725 RepID=UPI00193A26AA|nr:uncharacterized protein LOC120342736 [Styela clava]
MKTTFLRRITSFILLITGCLGYPSKLENEFSASNMNDDSVLRARLGELNAEFMDKAADADNDMSDENTDLDSQMAEIDTEEHEDVDRMIEQKVIEAILKRSLRGLYRKETEAESRNKRSQDPGRLNRDIPDYEEDMYSLRAVPFLFKKRSYDDWDRDFDDSLGFLFKRSQQNRAQKLASEFDDEKRAEFSPLFKRRGVPFLFRKEIEKPFLVSRLLHTIKGDERNIDDDSDEVSARDLDYLFKQSASASRQPNEKSFNAVEDMNKRYEMSALF